MLDDLVIDPGRPAAILPAHPHPHAGDAERDHIIVVGMIDQLESVGIDEHPPIEMHPQFGQGQPVDRALEQPRLAQLVQCHDIVIGTPAVIGVVDGEARHLPEILDIGGQARIVLRQRGQELDQRDRDLAGQKFVFAVEDRRAVERKPSALLDQLLQ